MKNNITTGVTVLLIGILFQSCSAIKFTSKYYYQHEKVLDQIEQTYRALYTKKACTVAFTDKAFNNVTLEIITDTLTYIYEFGVQEKRLNDTLLKYQIDTAKAHKLIGLMRSIRCTWVNNFDYYVDEAKRSLIFISIKPIVFHPLLSYKKYYILTFYSQPQHFDSQGRLLDKRTRKRLRKINGEIFYRINDKVCYTISGQFR